MRGATTLQAIIAGIALLIVGACGGGVVSWNDPMTLADGAGERLALDATGRAQLVADTASGVGPEFDQGACPASVRVARQLDALVAATWWSVRVDSSAVLLAAVSTDGGATWQAPIAVDSVDTSSDGCERPAPAIAASGGFVHIVYAMRAPEGAGVFYAHSMTRGQSFEPPVPIVYGDRVSPAAVAADLAVVGVAYEDPNGRTPAIGLAISTDWGHIFADRVRGSTGTGAASMPQVAVIGRQIAVSWLQRARGTDDASRATRIVRVGRLS